MGTKASAQTVINAIADGQENTAEEVRALGNVLLNELYPTPITDTNVTEAITNRLSSQVTYSLNFAKSGNQTTVIGTITVTLGAIGNLIEFTNPEYYPNNDIVQRFQINDKLFLINDGKITAVDFLPNGTYYVSLTYINNN